MPQPVGRRKLRITVTGTSVTSISAERPLLAMQMVDTLALFACVEMQIGSTLESIFKRDDPKRHAAIKVFVEQGSSARQRKKLLEAAKEFLAEDMQEELDALLSMLDTEQKRRNLIQ